MHDFIKEKKKSKKANPTSAVKGTKLDKFRNTSVHFSTINVIIF